MAPPQGMAESVIGAGGASLGKKKKKVFKKGQKTQNGERKREKQGSNTL